MKKVQLNIYVKESDVSGELPLYEVVVRRLLHSDVAGATVTRGLMGFGRHHKVHRTRLLGVADDRPLVITAVDSEERIRAVLPEVKRLVKGGLVTIQDVEAP